MTYVKLHLKICRSAGARTEGWHLAEAFEALGCALALALAMPACKVLVPTRNH